MNQQHVDDKVFSVTSSRRGFMRNSSLLVAGSALASQLKVAAAAHPWGDETIRIGLVGCGGRGTGAVHDAFQTEGPIRLVAVADVFEQRVAQCVQNLSREFNDKLDVPKERQFTGLDAYQQVLESDIDLVILATPPGFRPLHFEAAVNAGKHVFMEKPVAVDAPGVRRVLETTRVAKQNSLAVAVGLQRRHEKKYLETIKRIHDGEIGDIVMSRVYWNGEGVWTRPREPGDSEMRYQMRNWYYFNWLCGDHIVEQHIHNLDVGNWMKHDFPVSANGQGGREVRRGPDHGQIFDHHFVEFTYQDGSKMFSQCRHIPGCWNEVAEFAHGTRGSADVSGAILMGADGSPIWKFGRGGGAGHQQEHHDLFAKLRAGEIPNEGEYGAMSTMTAILGRMATYSGKTITMEDALAKGRSLGNVDEMHDFQATPPVLPDTDGNYPVAIPGEYQPFEDNDLAT